MDTVMLVDDEATGAGCDEGGGQLDGVDDPIRIIGEVKSLQVTSGDDSTGAFDDLEDAIIVATISQAHKFGVVTNDGGQEVGWLDDGIADLLVTHLAQVPVNTEPDEMAGSSDGLD